MCNDASDCQQLVAVCCQCSACMHSKATLTVQSSAGLFQMDCVTKSDANAATMWGIITPFTTLALVLLGMLCFYLVYRKRLQKDWETMRINALKRR